jgi:putative ATP-binding cassette transporter
MLCRRILESPLKHLEEMGGHRILNVLTTDVAMVAHAMNGIPSLAVSLVILVGGAAYLGWLSLGLMLAVAAFCLTGMAGYWYAIVHVKRFVKRSRESQDVLLKHVRELMEGLKELKMHHVRRQQFLERALEPAELTRGRDRFICDSLYEGAVAVGRLLFFVAIGLLLFVWPRFFPTDSGTLTGYVLTILYLMSPVEQIMAWVPFMAYASVSVEHLNRLGLQLQTMEREPLALTPIDGWEQIELAGVTHEYRREGQTRGFVLGPIDLVLRPGEIVFIVGGNGSGKTTLAKLLTGLYVPQDGEIRLDGRPVTAENREGYRQLFSAVFDNALVFESLWGLEAADLDERAGRYLRQLGLDHLVNVNGGTFSTTALSRGQRKRLALLTAYLEDRPIYVFDEWAADQDPAFRKVFYLELLPELKRRGKTVVAITHDDRYFECADSLVRLEVGKLSEPLLQTALRESPPHEL